MSCVKIKNLLLIKFVQQSNKGVAKSLSPKGYLGSFEQTQSSRIIIDHNNS